MRWPKEPLVSVRGSILGHLFLEGGPISPGAALLTSPPLAALCDMHPMRALFLIPRNPPPKLKSKKWYVLPVGSEEATRDDGGRGGTGNPVSCPRWKPLVSFLLKGWGSM